MAKYLWTIHMNKTVCNMNIPYLQQDRFFRSMYLIFVNLYFILYTFGIQLNTFEVESSTFGVESDTFWVESNTFGVDSNTFEVDSDTFGVDSNTFGVFICIYICVLAFMYLYSCVCICVFVFVCLYQQSYHVWGLRGPLATTWLRSTQLWRNHRCHSDRILSQNRRSQSGRQDRCDRIFQENKVASARLVRMGNLTSDRPAKRPRSPL